MAFADDGYEILPLFSHGEIQRLRQAVSEHMDRVTRALLKPFDETAPDAPFDERIERLAATDQAYARLIAAAVATDAQHSATVTALGGDERLAAMAERLTGQPIEDRIIRLRGNSSTLPEERQPWHSDVARTEGACSSVLISAWIPLTDAGPGSGGLEIAPGRRSRPLTHDDGGAKFAIPPEALANVAIAVPTVPAGHCLFMDRFTPHRAIANASGRTRWSLVVWMKSQSADSPS